MFRAPRTCYLRSDSSSSGPADHRLLHLGTENGGVQCNSVHLVLISIYSPVCTIANVEYINRFPELMDFFPPSVTTGSVLCVCYVCSFYRRSAHLHMFMYTYMYMQSAHDVDISLGRGYFVIKPPNTSYVRRP